MKKVLFSILALAGLLLLSGEVSRNVLAQNAPPAPTTCSNATLAGTYVFEETRSTVDPHGALSPFVFSGIEVYAGDGTAHGVGTQTSIVNGQTTVQSNVPFTGVYTVNANCTVQETDTQGGVQSHFDQFLQPSGDKFTFVETDPGVIA